MQLWTRKSQVTEELIVPSIVCVVSYVYGYKLNLICVFLYSLYCMPASLAVSCSSMQCRNSNLMVGNYTAQQSSAGCNITSCNYGGFVNGTIVTTYVFFSIFFFLLLCV